jgi:predicted GNAT superfamily acetyltransferase
MSDAIANTNPNPNPNPITITITIRPAETMADYRACQEAQRRAWGITEDDYIVPIATLVGAQLHGGLVLGAFLPDGSAVGLSFAFLGRVEGRLGLYSQLTGIVPGQQGRGLGGRLKQVQWEFARAAGLELIAWAFDPLQAGNAHFNLGRLGARSHTYIENMYGTRTDALNAGVPTDRLIVTWSTREPPPARVARDETALQAIPRAVESVVRSDGLRDVDVVVAAAAVAVLATLDEPLVLVEIPEEIGRLRAADPELAERWRGTVANAFQRLFAAGFEAVDFVRTKRAGSPRCFYLLRRGTCEH